MRRNFVRLCSAIDLNGVPSKYYPRFRPRRLVMPVDPSDVHSSKRQANPLFEKHKQQTRLRRSAERRGAMTLATVPAERSVGDVFRLMLQVCEEQNYFSSDASLTPAHLEPLATLLSDLASVDKPTVSNPVAERATGSSTLYNLATDSAREMDIAAHHSSTRQISVQTADTMWALLDRTPLNSPVHGVLAQRGKAVAEGTIVRMAYTAFPRLRSKHVQQLVHETCGLLPCSRVAVRLGFAEYAGVSTEIGMWRELNVLTQRFQVARRKAAAHLQRVEKGITNQRRWYWRAVLRSAAGRLKLFPVNVEDLLPRMEWIRSNMFAFLGFVELAERAGDPHISVDTLVKTLFCPQLARFVRGEHLRQTASAKLGELQSIAGQQMDSTAASAEAVVDRDRRRALLQSLRDELHRVAQRSADEEELQERAVHPLNQRADARREQFESSGGAHATQALRDDLFDDEQVARHHGEAPPIILHALQAPNALKEAQIILKHAPNVAPALRRAPLDVDQVVRRVVEVHETNRYASLPTAQQFRQVEYTVCRLFCGPRCVGEGKGETLMEAMQEAAQHMITNYYLRRPSRAVEDLKESSESATAGSPSDTAAAGGGAEVKIRFNKPRTSEEIVF